MKPALYTPAPAQQQAEGFSCAGPKLSISKQTRKKTPEHLGAGVVAQWVNTQLGVLTPILEYDFEAWALFLILYPLSRGPYINETFLSIKKKNSTS